ncbi:lipase family protein [Williamsia deligens]|uniref:Lipase family protein n=1 Tax=Williamsia deligens TaxID=321325 RepID=A0ABW3G2T1_9NOCA|nr:lipase family protein [Williamsia deligens]MCP2194733.1 Secretory lipase [Williamsia deligens]
MRVRAPLLLAMLLTVSACATDTPAEVAAPASSVAPGALVSPPTRGDGYPALDDVTRDISAIRYRTTARDGTPRTANGIVFTPRDDPPPGGYRVAAIAHPNTGASSDCAPTSYPGLLGSLGSVAYFLAAGYVVVFTEDPVTSDDSGALSAETGRAGGRPHPFLEPYSSAHTLIDGVRAARATVARTSTEWVAYGVSQGGQASWAANQLATSYGAGLRLLGSLSISPSADLRGLVDKMVAGTLSTAQRVALPVVLEGVSAASPGFRVADYLRGSMAAARPVFLSCTGDQEAAKVGIATAAPVSDFRPSSAAAADRLREELGRFAVPVSGQRASAPMFVAYGTDDTLIDPRWTVDAVRRSCRAGAVVDLRVVRGQPHGTLDLGPAPQDWVDDRAAGVRAPDSCPDL